MFDGDAEPDPFDRTQVRFIARKRREDGIDALLGPGMIQHIDVFQGGCIVLTVAPELVPIEGDRIGHTEIVEGTEKLFLQCLGQANLCGKTVSKVCSHVVTVHPLRCSGQTEKDLLGKVIEDRPITGGGSMMGLIDHNVIVEVFADLLPQAPTRQHSYGTEQMLKAIGLKRADQQLTKVLITKNIAKGSLCLLENLLAVSDKQESGLPLLLLEEAFEVEGGNHRLTGTGGCYHQIAPAVVCAAFPLQCLKDSFLKRVRPKVEEDSRAVCTTIAGVVNSRPEEGWIGRIKRHELTTVPVGLKLNGELFENMPHILSCYLKIPFQAAGNGRMGHVGRTDVGRGEPGVALEVVCLGMEQGPLGIVGDADIN